MNQPQPAHISAILFAGALLLSVSIASVVKSVEIAPEKEIVILDKTLEQPQWKMMWDKARDYARNKDYQNALVFYKKVLDEKPHIEEVKWELCRLYFETEKYDEALMLINSLLEIDPNRTEYLISAGNIALKTEKAPQAVLYFGQVLEQDPGGSYYHIALEGMIAALLEQRKKEIAIPLMEQLYQTGGESSVLLLQLAQAFRDVGDLQKSHYYFQELVNKYRVSELTVLQAATVSEQLQDLDTAAGLWERYLEDKPEAYYIRRKLAEFYLKEKREELAYPHLEVLIDQNINRERYLPLASRINLYTFGRADKALGYLEMYNQEFPGNQDVATEIQQIRLILANNLLSIVENDGVVRLWADLASITPDRLGIFKAIADLLEALERRKQLIEVLEIIASNDPEDLEIKYRLSRLFYESRFYRRCLNTVRSIQYEGPPPQKYYTLKFKCERALYSDFELIKSYREYLRYYPGDDTILQETIRLAGAVGDLPTLTNLIKEFIDNKDIHARKKFEIGKTAVDALVVNQLYSQALHLVDTLLLNRESTDHAYVPLIRERARLNHLQELPYKAEQLLREAATKNPQRYLVFNDLAAHALDNNDIKSAHIWLQQAEKEYTRRNLGADRYGSAPLFMSGLTLLNRTGETKKFQKTAEDYLSTKAEAGTLSQQDYEIFRMLIAFYFKEKSIDRFQEAVQTYYPFFNNPGLVSILQSTLDSQKTKDSFSLSTEILTNSSTLDLIALFELLAFIGATDTAEELLEYLSAILKDSHRFKILNLQLLELKRDYVNAAKKYDALSKLFPEETYFVHQKIRYETFSGIASYPADMIEYEATYRPRKELFSARKLWENEQESEALSIYETLESSLRKKLSQLWDELQTDPDYQAMRDVPFWDELLGSESDLDFLDKVMEASSFIANLEANSAPLVATSYTDYRWYRVISKEKRAKEALYEKKFYQAEKRYQELLEEDVESVEVYSDLATVYDRLGRIAKETELLETIKEQKIQYPKLQPIVEKNIKRRRPRLYLDGLFREEDGRNGAIDIKQQTYGIGLDILPTLYQETGFHAGRTIYGNSFDNSLLTSNAISGHYSIFFGNEGIFRAEIGFEDIEEEGNAYVVYDLNVSGNLADSVWGHVSFDQQLVSDTIQSLSTGIYRRDYQAGLVIDPLPQIFLGIDFIFRDYNDDNDGKKFDLWASYRLFSEVNRVDITYNYIKMENKFDSTADSLTASNEFVQDLGYWSPGNYWKHNLAAKVKRELWPIGKRQSGSSYVEAHYDIGYETGDNLIQQFGFDILLEISDPFLLKGTFVTDWSDDYNRTQGYISFIYRW